jgi:hypothetical protein
LTNLEVIIPSVIVGISGLLRIDNLSLVVPQRPAFSYFIFSLYVNLIPPGVIDVVPSKALSPILVTPSAEIVFKLLTPLKASLPIDVTVFGNVIEVISALF